MSLELILQHLADCSLVGEIVLDGQEKLFGGNQKVQTNISLLPHMPIYADGYEDDFLILKVDEKWCVRKWLWGEWLEFKFATPLDVPPFLCAIQAIDCGIPKEHPSINQLKKLNMAININDKWIATKEENSYSGFGVMNKGKIYLALIYHEKTRQNNGLVKYAEDLQVVIDAVMKFYEANDVL